MKSFFTTFRLALFAGAVFLGTWGVRAESGKPNLLVIMVDDLGYGDLSLYGAPDLKTPHIDALMNAGTRFDAFYANCSVCSPTRASFLTGMYPDRAGVPGVIRTPLPNQSTSWGNLRNDIPTLPVVLGEAGYDTALIGKWHLGLEAPDRPTDVGFDFFNGFLGDMMDDYYDHLRHEKHYMRRNEEPIYPEGHATDIFTEWTIDYLRSQAEKDSPFFLFLAYNAPHTPIQPPADWLAKVKQREEGISDQRAALVALIEHLDDGVGRVVRALKENGQWENTVVVFTSDNGGQLNVGARNEPWRGGKQEMWEGGIRVGTSVTWPGVIVAGKVDAEHDLITMDLYPTLADLGGASVGHAIDGRSFAPLLRGEPFYPERRPLFWVRREGNLKYGGLDYHAVRIGDWKLLRNTPFEPYQMFRKEQHEGEKKYIPIEIEQQRIVKLIEALLAHINKVGQIPWQREHP